MTVEQSNSHRQAPILTAAGLVSGLLTVALSYASGTLRWGLFPGVLLGVATTSCLALLGALANIWKALRFFALVGLAYPIAILVASAFEATIGGLLSLLIERTEHPSPVSLFAGGVAGAFLILLDLLHEVRPQVRRSDLVQSALSWSLLGGVLGVLGWILGPTLGMGLWSVAHATRLASPSETYQNALKDSSHMLSLFVIWQSGMGLVLGLVLRRYKGRSGLKELNTL